MSRLGTKAPELEGLFNSATSDQQRLAAFLACSVAVRSVRLDGPDVTRALAVLQSRLTPDLALSHVMVQLCEHLDDQYFRCEDENDEVGSQRFFSQARAASALSMALKLPAGGLHEAIYEAIACVDDFAEVEKAARGALT